MGAPGGVEPPTNGLGNRCSIQLSYGAVRGQHIISRKFIQSIQAGIRNRSIALSGAKDLCDERWQCKSFERRSVHTEFFFDLKFLSTFARYL